MGDVRIVEYGERLGLALESAHAIRIGSEKRWEHFDGHVAVELRVVCSIDFTHSASTE